jgi:hypothetical protein
MNTDELLKQFRSDVPFPDEKGTRRAYERSTRSRRLIPGRRLAIVAVLAVAVVAAAVVAATWSQPAGALPAPFQPAQVALSSQFGINVSPLPDSTSVALTMDQAEAIVMRRYRSAPPGVTATLVTATDSQYATVAPTGERTLVISNRAAWLVLVPGQQTPIIYPYGKTGPYSYATTSAVLIDANTGAVLIEAALPGS